MFSTLNKEASSASNGNSFTLLNMTLAERLLIALELAQMTQAGLARCVGLTRGAVSLWFDGSTKSLAGNNLLKAARCLGVDPQWLATGEGPDPRINPKLKEAPFTYVTDQPSTKPGRVPLISWTDAAHWIEVIQTLDAKDVAEWLPCPVEHSDLTFVLRVRGESMNNPHVRPSFAEGDLIFVDPAKEPAHRDFVIVRMGESAEALFRQLIVEGDKRHLKAINPSWPEPLLEVGREAVLCGVVIFKGERL